MNLAIVMPVILKHVPLWDLTRECVAHLRTSHSASLYVICNALHVCTAQELRDDLRGHFPGPVFVLNEPGVSRSVAGSWNAGAEMAFARGAQFVAVIANDAFLRPDCLDQMIAFGESRQAEIWSGISYNNRTTIDAAAVADGADFTCFMFPSSTLETFGPFDTNFKPAYFGDNDYYARVVLGGGRCRVLHSAQFFHHGSMTIRHDPDAAHHVRHWFDLNRAYFHRKWGVSEPAANAEDVFARYYRHPFNDPARPLSWFPENGNP